jgi:putative peptide zinc metalloprotease protein
MAGPLFSTSWYRVAALTPRLRSHAQIHRHRYRGFTWYVLQDLSTERFHRFSPAAHLIIGLMDGRRTVQEIWDVAAGRLGDDAPTQDEMIQLLAQLHGADVLQCDVPPDAEEILRRYEREQRRQWQSRLFSVFSWRIPLVDPERFLERWLPFVGPLVGWAGALLWLAVVGPAAVLAAAHWGDLTANVADRVLAPQNLLLLWLVFPAVKALHELGHAFAARRFGGEVHDLGVMILVLTPVPYVDASSSWAFRSKWARVAVGAAGMVVELFLAALALFVWLAVEPGTVRLVAYNVVFIAGVSTLVFNANPLLRFDGYYILADLIEIPNLRARASAWVGYLVERHLLGRTEAEAPPATPGERRWFVVFAIGSFLYRVAVSVAILVFVASQFFAVGVLLAALGVVTWVLVPLVRGASFLFTSPRLRRVRRRALVATGSLTAGALLVTCLIPMPLRTVGEGVVWIADEAIVRAGTEGFVDRIVATPGARVGRGDVLVVLREPSVTARAEVAAARLRELQARADEQLVTDRVRSDILKEEMAQAARELALAREREAELTVKSRAAGTFVAPRAEELPERFVKRGELLGYVVDPGAVTVRAVVPQDNSQLVRHRTRGAEVRLAERMPRVLAAVVRRVVPGASDRLPTSALGTAGGGRIPVDPTDPEGVKVLQPVFQLDLELPPGAGVAHVGGRAYVRFDHGWEPLAVQAYRRVRQLFLSRFNV